MTPRERLQATQLRGTHAECEDRYHKKLLFLRLAQYVKSRIRKLCSEIWALRFFPQSLASLSEGKAQDLKTFLRDQLDLFLEMVPLGGSPPPALIEETTLQMIHHPACTTGTWSADFLRPAIIFQMRGPLFHKCPSSFPSSFPNKRLSEQISDSIVWLWFLCIV